MTTPKLPPPPRTAQNRSGCSSSLAVMSRPSAVTISTACEGVDGQAVLAGEPADAATERQPGDPDRAGVAERRREAVGRGRLRVLHRREAGLRPGDAAVDVDVEALHPAQVEDDAAVDRAVARDAVPAGADGELHPGLRGERHGPRDVALAGGSHDHRGVAVVGQVVDLAGAVVVGLAGEDHLAQELGLERGEIERVARGRGGAGGMLPRP